MSASPRALIIDGPTGSGSTTTAVSVGLAAARAGHRVAVSLINPLADLHQAAGVDPAGGIVRSQLHDGLWVEQLDIGATFDGLVTAVADDEATAATVAENPLYGALTSSLPGARDFMILERLTQLRDSGRWDLIVMDSPPSRPAGEFLTAPDRVTGFLGHPVYRAMSIGQRALGRVADAALSSFLGSVRRVAGAEVADNTVDFFRAIAALESGLRDRLATATDYVGSDACGFVVVTTPQPEAVEGAIQLVERLTDVGNLRAMVANQVFTDPPAGATAEEVEWWSGVSDEGRRRLDAVSDMRPGIPLVEVPHQGVDPIDAVLLGHVADRLAGLV